MKDIGFDYYKIYQRTNGNSLFLNVWKVERELDMFPEVLRNKEISGYTVRFRELIKINVDDIPKSKFSWIGHIEK